MNQLHLDVALGVSEATVTSVIAPLKVVWIEGTKLGLVFVGVVKLLDSVMRLFTGVTIWAVICMLSEVDRVCRCPSPVPKGVIEFAQLRIVGCLDLTGVHLEGSKVDMRRDF
jgi:hypothetical protein